VNPLAPQDRHPSSIDSIRRALRDADDLPEVLDHLESWLRSETNIDGYFVNLHQAADQSLISVRVHFPAEFASMEKTYLNYVFPADSDNASAHAFSGAQPVNIFKRDLAKYPEVTRMTFEMMQLRQLIALPILVNESRRKPEGSLTLFVRKAAISQPQQRRIARVLGEFAPFIRLHSEIANWRTRASTIRNTEMELQSLLSFIAEVASLTTDREIYPRIQKEFLRRFDMDVAAVLLHEQEQLRCADTSSRPHNVPWAATWRKHCETLGYAIDISEGASSHVFINNQHLYFGDIPALRGLHMSPKDRANLDILAQLQSLAILPIRKYGKPIGVLWLGNTRRKHANSTEQLVLIQHLCDFLGAIIENSQTYTLVEEQRRKIEMLAAALQNRVEVLDQLASRDRLTGLYNFGSFEAELRKRFALYQEQQPQPQPLSIIMCDVDFFKRFNDTFGHVAGNDVLQEVAKRISRTVRESDYVARYGGEEFVVLLGRCSLEAAGRLAERIRENICKEPFIVDGVAHSISLSLGCAELRLSDDPAGFIARADTALYAAKQNGRNRVEISN